MNPRAFWLFFLFIAVSACGDDDATAVDAGTDRGGTDAGRRDAGPRLFDAGPGMDSSVTGPGVEPPGPGTCEMPQEVALRVGTQTISGNTVLKPARQTLTVCGVADANQEVVELTVPASASPLAVELSTAVPGTDRTFDTVVEVRRNECGDESGAICIDDGSGTESDGRSVGGFVASGGDRVYLIVTGQDPSSPADVGPWTMELVLSSNPAAPTLAEATAIRTGSTVTLFVTGDDSDANASRVAVTFLDAMGAAVGDERAVRLIPPITTTTVEASVTTVDVPAEAASAEVSLVDRTNLASPALEVPLEDPAAPGEPCIDDIACDSESCTTGVCDIPADAMAACAGASALTADPSMVLSQTARLEPGPGALQGSCGNTGGDEAVFEVTVPAGDYDLVLGTNNSETTADTVLYVANACGFDSVACNDDISGSDRRSRLTVEDVGGSTVFAMVEPNRDLTLSVTVQLDVQLRPLLGPGETCDPSVVANRCLAGACPSTGDPRCP